jgi:O-antigen/teichoic acid export membrane protein
MLKNNIVANLLGNALTAIVSIICIPVYVHYLGVEAYGLIGIYASLQVIFSVLDMGLSATLNREFARLSVQDGGHIEQKNLLRTFEYIYAVIAVAIGLIILLFSSLISKHWLTGNSIPPSTVQFVLVQIGILIALRWPTALYAGGLTGLQKQVLYNIINTAGEFVKSVGAVIVLAFINSSVTTFFYWQIIISGLIVLLLRSNLWKKIPASIGEPIFTKALIKKNRNFAAGMGATSLVVIILTQTDKIILSKILTLETFGYFTLASAIASSLYRVIVPVSQAVYPRLVQLVHSKQEADLIKLFHNSCQLIAIIVLPLTFTIVFFSDEIVMLWTRNVTITAAVSPLLKILIIGTACNALVTIPYMTQLAYGWTKLGLYQNVIAIIILIPSVIYLSNKYGAYGAVWVWAVLNASYLAFSMPIMFSKILKDQMWYWYKYDLLKLIFISFFTAILCRWIFRAIDSNNLWFIITYCAITFTLVLTCSVLSVTYIRNIIIMQYKLFFTKQQ